MLKRLLILFATIGLAGAAAAQVPPMFPVEHFFQDPIFNSPTLSPSGRYLGVLVPINDRQNLVVIDLTNGSRTVITSFTTEEVVGFFWKGDETIVFNQTLTAGGQQSPFDQFTRWFMVNRDGKRVRPVGGDIPLNRSIFLLSQLPNDPENLLIASNVRNADSSDTYKVNVRTGRLTTVETNVGLTQGAEVDSQGYLRVKTLVEEDNRGDFTQRRIRYRPTPKAEWQDLVRFDMFNDLATTVAILPDDNRLLISTRRGTDTAALWTFDMAKGEYIEQIVHDPVYDVGPALGGRFFPLFSPRSDRFLGVFYDAEKPKTVWFDKAMASLQANLEATFPGNTVFISSASDDMTKMVVTVAAAHNPGEFFLYTTPGEGRTGSLEPIAKRKPWIDPATMAETKPISFQARDGYTLRGYLTLPRGREPKNLPFILHPHGGPWARDTWSWNTAFPEVQFLANRGFAVLQVDFRGSEGYGLKHLESSYLNMGTIMRWDKEDATKWAIAQGIADPERTGIYGASYGGYAAMSGLVYSPELYRFGINYVGVINVERHIRWYKSIRRREAFYFWQRRVGDPDDASQLAMLRDISPVNFVDRIKVPLFVIHGLYDANVGIEQYQELLGALDRARVPYKSMMADDEAHGFRDDRNQYKLYRAFDEFLAPFMAPGPAGETTAPDYVQGRNGGGRRARGEE